MGALEGGREGETVGFVVEAAVLGLTGWPVGAEALGSWLTLV